MSSTLWCKRCFPLSLDLGTHKNKTLGEKTMNKTLWVCRTPTLTTPTCLPHIPIFVLPTYLPHIPSPQRRPHTFLLHRASFFLNQRLPPWHPAWGECQPQWGWIRGGGPEADAGRGGGCRGLMEGARRWGGREDGGDSQHPPVPPPGGNVGWAGGAYCARLACVNAGCAIRTYCTATLSHAKNIQSKRK